MFTTVKDQPSSGSDYSAGYDNNSDITSLKNVKQEDTAVVEIDHAEDEGGHSSSSTVLIHRESPTLQATWSDHIGGNNIE